MGQPRYIYAARDLSNNVAWQSIGPEIEMLEVHLQLERHDMTFAKWEKAGDLVKGSNIAIFKTRSLTIGEWAG